MCSFQTGEGRKPQCTARLTQPRHQLSLPIPPHAFRLVWGTLQIRDMLDVMTGFVILARERKLTNYVVEKIQATFVHTDLPRNEDKTTQIWRPPKDNEETAKSTQKVWLLSVCSAGPPCQPGRTKAPWVPPTQHRQGLQRWGHGIHQSRCKDTGSRLWALKVRAEFTHTSSY